MTTDNLLIGPATIFVGPAGSTAVDAASIANLKDGILPAGWINAGMTTSATTLTDTPEYAEARSQQTARVLAKAVTGIATTIATTVREVTVDLVKDMGRGAVSVDGSTSTVSPSGLGLTPTFSVAVLGPWPGGDLLFVAPRATFVGERALPISSGEFTEVALEIEVLETSAGGFDGGYKVHVVEGTLGS
jgi:hypothetical protein